MATTITDKLYLFYHGPFSQWHPAQFIYDGINYTCAEQAMMLEKARLFDDTDILSQIMATSDPRTHKVLGRKVRNFDPEKWSKVCRQLVTEINVAKFSQNPDLLQELLNTGDRIIAEASQRDRIWGIGLGVNNPLALEPDKWRGKNWLGECLMVARGQIKAM